jgi:hypothetical protein
MNLNDEIRNWLFPRGVCGVKDCFIAHVKEMNGLPVPRAWNRRDPRSIQCPPEKIAPIEAALMRFNFNILPQPASDH